MSPRTPRGIRYLALSLATIASKLSSYRVRDRPEKCVHTNVTIGAIYVCTFCFHAP